MTPEQISPELVERMCALVHDLHADHVKYGSQDIEQDFVARTAAIVADLPKLVDPDVILAREIALNFSLPALFSCTGSSVVLEGGKDDECYMKAIRDALSRGRELAAKQ